MPYSLDCLHTWQFDSSFKSDDDVDVNNDNKELTTTVMIMTVPVTLNYSKVILNGLMIMTAKPLYAVYETANTGNTLENMIRKQVSF